ncbi:response regulator transcription factor [Piscinibacter sakaiensis]|uniref:Two-component response regulator n=1 Tax=Piscinibacter sakaiensis TaxID=1547922 RepID=A0A0K8P1P2_PISS1|nr:response regulator transcription factor [Piscinibacter sakaiensis]GAP36090.1 two-component response regulator [Piscinibacter sakaiensis]
MRIERALIVEDLDEPRRWLAERLPAALPSVPQVDLAASLAEARALMARHAYGLALVDWGLPDGTAEGLIGELAGAREGALVIVATIHDDDAHVFPALRAGATGYILKSQPAAVVESQLRGIERGEPPLSPSIALRILRHFQALPPGAGAPPAEAAPRGEDPLDAPRLAAREVDVLRLIGRGHSAPEVARKLGLTPATTSSYVRNIYRKLGISSRAEAALEAARRGLFG